MVTLCKTIGETFTPSIALAFLAVTNTTHPQYLTTSGYTTIFATRLFAFSPESALQIVMRNGDL
jgi:hypothetical protein